MSRSNKEPAEAFTFYLDECLGGEKISQILLAANLKVELHYNHFKRGTPDREWLPVIGQNGWILLTQDKEIRRRAMEIAILRHYGVRAFVVSAKGLRGEEIGELIIQSLPKMMRILKKHHAPIVASISRGPVVNLLEGKPRNPR